LGKYAFEGFYPTTSMTKQTTEREQRVKREREQTFHYTWGGRAITRGQSRVFTVKKKRKQSHKPPKKKKKKKTPQKTKKRGGSVPGWAAEAQNRGREQRGPRRRGGGDLGGDSKGGEKKTRGFAATRVR